MALLFKIKTFFAASLTLPFLTSVSHIMITWVQGECLLPKRRFFEVKSKFQNVTFYISFNGLEKSLNTSNMADNSFLTRFLG